MKTQTYQNFNWNIPKIVVALSQGKDAEKLFKAYQNELKKFPISDWSSLKYNQNTKEIFNSNVFDAGILNFLINSSNLRVAVPKDDIGGEIYNLIKNKYHTNFNALVVRKTQLFFTKNNGLWKKVIELVEGNKGSIKFPFMVSGFYFAPDKTDKDYGLKIMPKQDFEIIEDDRLLEKYDRWKFDNVDEKGLPINLDKNKGSRTFYTREEGLSRVCLDWVGGLNTGCDGLADFSDIGRVVLVGNTESVANASQKVLEEKIFNLQKERDTEINKINQRYQKAELVLKGKN